LADKAIFDITKFTMLDFPDHLACIVWFAGCDMRCSYCYNPHVVLGGGKISEDELLDFLNSRKGRLEGVVMSGGECTLYPHLLRLCQKIKNLGLKVKIDTNGSRPNILRDLIDEAAIDYVALDFKAPERLFDDVTLSGLYDKTLESLRLLIDSGVSFEVRTTIHSDLIDEEAVNEVASLLSREGYKGTYYIQNFIEAPQTLGGIAPQSRRFNRTLLSQAVPIEMRNF
jgi:pyruvate formate lyase activating enzyme